MLVGDRGPGSRRWCTNSSEVVESGEEATMSPVGLSYPKAKRRLERRMTEAKELHKIGVDELLIKMAESEGLRIDAGVGDKGDGEDDTIPEVTRTIKDLL
ncbi:hypothetical protein B296_00045245 [Ensete ventricosum]|uniref:Uncharacterized protein n=1 Tax=Ensete ventricosum TaxID=4639 RepID=A0A426X489_ENSVE|nr:hypothetical protein B296_00045245 [Ensete ventricosum]